MSDEALKYAETAVSLAPEDPGRAGHLGYIYYGKNLYDSALSYFKPAVQKRPTPVRKYHLALAYSKTEAHGGSELKRRSANGSETADAGNCAINPEAPAPRI